MQRRMRGSPCRDVSNPAQRAAHDGLGPALRTGVPRAYLEQEAQGHRVLRQLLQHLPDGLHAPLQQMPEAENRDNGTLLYMDKSILLLRDNSTYCTGKKEFYCIVTIVFYCIGTTVQ